MDSVEISKKIIVAIDDTSRERINNIVELTAPFVSIYKIGSITFTAYGPSILEELKQKGKDVFLDLKYFDIPNTVSKAVMEAVKYGVKMLTLHTLGGEEMLKSAVEASAGRTILLGVTLLTSMDQSQLNKFGINASVSDMVEKLALLAVNAGVDGLVASGYEVGRLRNVLGNKPIIVVPGIRLKDKVAGDDQKRIVSPKEAFDAGANYIVMGRPITESKNPGDVLRQIINALR
ncbi:MAG: orotidine-5'-phosphate decarboxylase [bacterium]